MIAKAVTAVGALALLGAMFLDWYGFDIKGTTLGGATQVDAWAAFEWVDLALVVAVVAGLTTAMLGARVPVLGTAALAAATGGLAALLILYRWIDPPVEAGSTGFATVAIDVRAGVPLGLAAALVLAAGGAWALRKSP